MTLNELLAHNYEVMKGGDWVGFRFSYTLENDNTVKWYWEVTRKDHNKKNGFIVTHSSDGHNSAGMFNIDNIRQYWERQLEWFYEVQMGIR